MGGGFSLLSGAISTDNGLNITKLFLAILTLFYDFVMLFQRFCLYPPKKGKTHQSLLEDLEEEETETKPC